MGFFERYLSVWVLGGIGLGIAVGSFLGSSIHFLADLQIANVNIPVAILVWAMIFPMMVQIDFNSLSKVTRAPQGLILTLSVNWLIKPFTMALIGWFFFYHVFQGWLPPDRAQEYLAGAILLGAAPCTAMVFVWSYLTKGDPEYTLVQVAINDLVLLIAFVPIVQLLLGISDISIPQDTLIISIVTFVLLPLVAGYFARRFIVASRGISWLEQVFLPKLKPISISALLATLVLLFAFQGKKILEQPIDIFLIAIPLTLQTYLIFSVSWLLGKRLCLPHCILSPSSMIGASNFFELAVAIAIALFGLESGAALATVVGVLIEVPVMVSLVWFSNKNRF